MFPHNITRDEAQRRSAHLNTDSYRVLVDVSGADPEGNPLAEPEATFVSSSTVRFQADESVESYIDLIADSLYSASLDGQALDVAGFANSRLGFSVDAGWHELTVVGLCRFSRSGQGLHRFVDPADHKVYLYTQFEVSDARRMYACFEQPDLKATFELEVIAPRHWEVASNSAAVEPEPIRGDMARWSFAPTLRISTYITALIAGEYYREHSSFSAAGGEVPMSLLCRQSVKDHLDSDRILATTHGGFKVFEEHFGMAYPFGSYDQAFVPEYNMGAMENAGCITFRDEYLFRSRQTSAAYESRDNTILHELAHMWFGDLVTMTWWDDLWLNESFAEWASHFAQAEMAEDPLSVWAMFTNARKNWAYRQDQLPTTHPIAADMVDLEAVELNFDGITYAKGASTLRQLVAFVGREEFLAGIRDYFAEHAFGNTQLKDLLIALEKSSGRDLSGWSAEWLEKPGVNLLRADFDVDDAGTFTRFAISQSAIESAPTLRHHRIAIGLYNLVDGTLTRTERFETDIADASTEVAELVGKSRPDLLLVNDDDLTYAKIRLDDRSQATVIEHLSDLESDLARAVCWGAAWDMCRDGELPAREYVELAFGAVAAETDLSGVAKVLAQARSAVNNYAPRDQRADLVQQLETGTGRLLRSAEPGSDHQLAFARGLAASVESDAGVSVLEGWLSGAEIPDGLTVDADLRWLVLSDLAALGRVGDAEIDAELAQDNTITGSQNAAGARAAQPLAEAKAAAWERATNDATVPNETHQQIVASFWQFGQEDVLAGYGDRYLQMCEDISSSAGVWEKMGQTLQSNALESLYPSPYADQAWLDKVGDWMGSATLTEPVKRVLAERGDDAARALRAREANATSN